MAFNNNPLPVDTSIDDEDEKEQKKSDAADDYEAPDVPDGLEEALTDMITDAITHVEAAYAQSQADMTDYYKGELPGVTQDDLDNGRSDIVSRDVHDAFMATAPDLVRIFLGPEHIVEFEPSGGADEQIALQATEVVRHIFEKENDAFSIVHGALKDGLVRKFAVAMWYHQHVDKSFNQDYTLDPDTLATMLQDKGITVVSAKSTEVPGEDGQSPQEMVECTLRHDREAHQFIVDLVPPEEMIISRRARDFSGRWLVGRRRNMVAEELIGMGYPEDLVEAHLTADATIETSQVAAKRNPEGQTGVPPGTDSNTESARETLYIEAYVSWPYDDKFQLFKVCTIGTAHEIVACEPVDSVDMALWTPDPEPHTPIGESQAEKVVDIQRLKTGVWRGIVDSLAEALVPRTEVVEGQVNMDDAQSTEIGALVRVRQPNMVRPISTPFLGQQALPMIDSIDNMREERVGAFRAADGMSAEAMQSSTKMAVAATISGSKAQKELLARVFAANFLRPIFRGLLRLFVQHQDKPKTIRIAGKWVPVDPRGWNADMDCTVNVGVACMTNDEKLQMLGGIAEKQELILQTLGPNNPLCNLGHYSYTLRKMVQLGGFRNLDSFFGNLPTDAQQLQGIMAQIQQLQGPQQPDPAAQLSQAQIQALQAQSQREDAESAQKTAQAEEKHQADLQKQQRDEDFRRDQLAQDRSIRLFEISSKYGTSMAETEAKIDAEERARRDEHGNAILSQGLQHVADTVQHSQELQHQAVQGDQQRQADFAQHVTGLDAQAQEGEAQRDTDLVKHATGLDAQAQEGEAQRQLQDQQHQRDTQLAAQNAAADRKVKAKAAAKPKGPKK